MKFIDEYHNIELGQKLITRIHQLSTRPIRLMEFCGGHTVAILKHGIRQLLPPTIEMLSGPGCPVCVTANADLDKAIAMAYLPDVIIATFGDMIKVPGSYSSFQKAKAAGADIRIVYSTQDALDIAQNNPTKPVIFIGVGFETTAPTIAASILEAEKRRLKNFFVFPLLKLCPPAIKLLLMIALVGLSEVKLDGIICPGHVSAIIGSHPWEFIPRQYKIACVISGFEPLDILLSIAMLVAKIKQGKPKVEISYLRGVKPEGNKHALELMNQVFESTTANWRGIGKVPLGGLKLKKEYEHFNAESNFPVNPGVTRENKDCLCGDILRGAKTPPQCKLFGRACTPENPVGACMVSSEGACAAYFQYGVKYG